MKRIRLSCELLFSSFSRYVTRHLLAFPIVDIGGNCLGVIQAINKNAGGAMVRGAWFCVYLNIWKCVKCVKAKMIQLKYGLLWLVATRFLVAESGFWAFGASQMDAPTCGMTDMCVLLKHGASSIAMNLRERRNRIPTDPANVIVSCTNY
jgi:hypothetical protein